MLRTTLTLLFCLLLPVAAQAEDVTLGDLTISQTLARPTIAAARAGAGYLTIKNSGDTDDRLLAVGADFPRVMIHDTVMDGDVARMQHVMMVDVPAGGTVQFAPGGLHVMFMGLDGDPFELGEQIPATLIFENAGQVDILFTVADIPNP